MRKYFIDNIRAIAILFLFPFHAAMVFNNFGDNFYVFGGENAVISLFVLVLFPVLMPLLFVI